MINEEKLIRYQEIVDKLFQNSPLNEEENLIVKNDIDFKNYQKENSIIHHAITHSALNEKLNELNKLEEKYQNSDMKNPKKTRRLFFALTAASVLLFLSYFLFFYGEGGKSYDGDLLASDFVINYPTGFESRSSSNNNNIDSSYVNYVKGEALHKAIKDLEKRVEIDDDPKHKFFLAISYQRVEKWKDAEKLLEREDVRSLKDIPSNYFLAVSKTGLRKTKEAIELLEAPKTGKESINMQGEKLLKILKRKL